jgi:protocatechuate 3,4-dioxygenase beta subunit
MARVSSFLVAVGISAVCAAQAPPRDTSASSTGTASIRGRVTDASGRPLSRVEIRAPNGTGDIANGLTDGDGRFTITGLPAGTYTINATKANYVRAAWGEQRPEGPGTRVTIADGQRIDNLNFRLARAGVITGKIVDEFGDPVTDVVVSAMRYQYVQGTRRLMPSGRGGQTNDIGEFRLYGLSPGQYYVSATLRAVAMIGGDTADREGYAPTFYPGTGSAADAQRLTIAAGQTMTGINLSLLPIRTAKISGTVVDASGNPLLTMMVLIMPKSSASFASVMPNQVRPDGQFTINGVTPGEYTLRAGGPAAEMASVDVTVSGSDVSGVQLVLAKPSAIRGRIVFTASANASDPPKATTIDLGAVREWALAQPVRSPARIKDDGSFEISLAAGHVQLRAAPTGGSASVAPWRLSRVIFNDIDVGDSGIDVPQNGTVDNVVVEITNRTNEVTGRVTDADGRIVRDCFVIVFAQDPSRWTVQTRYLSVARPAGDDSYRVRLLPGDYFAVAMSDVEVNAWTDPDFLALARERAVKLAIADGEKKTLDLPLTPAPVF